jgi:hypothetical protein
VRHAEFYTRSIRKVRTSAFDEADAKAENEADDEVGPRKPSRVDERAPAMRSQDNDARIVRILSWLRVTAWIIVALLVVIAMK